MADDYESGIVTVLDDDGNEHQFELLDAIETDDGRYVALLPITLPKTWMTTES